MYRNSLSSKSSPDHSLDESFMSERSRPTAKPTEGMLVRRKRPQSNSGTSTSPHLSETKNNNSDVINLIDSGESKSQTQQLLSQSMTDTRVRFLGSDCTILKFGTTNSHNMQ